MEGFLESNSTALLFYAMVGALLVGGVLEALIPCRSETTGTNYRWFNNIAMSLLNQINVNWFAAFVTLSIAVWGEESDFGLLRWSEVGFIPSVICAILVFELVNYWFHRAMHTFPLLWRIHVVHHSDTELDFTTTYRSHPLELYLVAPLTIPLVLLVGFPPAAVVLYQILRISISILAHSNIEWPERVDRLLRRVIVTPGYHRVHHSSDRPFTNSNYAASFTLWDHVFGTARTIPHSEQRTMEIGLEYYRNRGDSRLDRLLLMPFTWRRDLWKDAEKPRDVVDAERVAS